MIISIPALMACAQLAFEQPVTCPIPFQSEITIPLKFSSSRSSEVRSDFEPCTFSPLMLLKVAMTVSTSASKAPM